MAVTYTTQISDVDYKALCYVTDNPSQYVDDNVTEYIRQMKEQMVKQLIKDELAKPGIREIPADKEELIAKASIKTAKQSMEEDAARMVAMVADPSAPEIVVGPSATLPE
jgi:uncharacterized phage protein gp47/JayE